MVVKMITNYGMDAEGHLAKTDLPIDQALWIDVYNPTHLERILLEEMFQVVLPEHHEMHQLEYSNRFYEEKGAFVLSLNVVTKSLPLPENHVVTFVLTADKVLTLRYSEPNPLKTFGDNLALRHFHVNSHYDVLLLLLDAVVGRVADTFELIEEKTENLTLSLDSSLSHKPGKKRKQTLGNSLKEINDLDNLLSKGVQSISSMELFLGYLRQIKSQHRIDESLLLEDLTQDTKALLKHSEYVSRKLNFQLQSTLGIINIEQSEIIKMFTVLAMVFMPPTLIASIYGMNFAFMPELKWHGGYIFAIVLMLVSAFLPYRIFKKRHWI